MTDALLEYLADTLPPGLLKTEQDTANAREYLKHLTSLPLNSILHVEAESLKSNKHSLDLSLQSAVSRSHRSIIKSSDELSTVPESIAKLRESVQRLRESVPKLESSITSFSSTFQKGSAVLVERQRRHVFARALPKVLDILELPSLLQSAISSSNPSLSLDIHSHVKRLAQLYPSIPVIKSIGTECDELLQSLNTQLLNSLRQPLRLPVAIKTIGYLKRTSPEMGSGEEIWGSIFLVSRLAFLANILQALEPLKDLAEVEREEWETTVAKGTADSVKGGGSQSEKYLKRWIEVFREHSFAIVSMYKAIFPSDSSSLSSSSSASSASSSFLKPHTSSYTSQIPLSPTALSRPEKDGLEKPPSPPSPLATFVPHLLKLLSTTLHRYLPIISDKSARESLLTQVLYAAGSLGRLGGDFGLALSTGILKDPLKPVDVANAEYQEGGDYYNDEDDEEGGEWVDVVKKHRILAERLEDLAAGKGIRTGDNIRRGSSPLLS